MTINRQKSRAHQALERLDTAHRENQDDLLAAIRHIKNSIIGNRTLKTFYLQNLSIGPRLADCYTSHDPNVKSEIAVVISSLAQHDATPILAAGLLGPLLESLSAKDLRVVESAARAVRAIVQQPLDIPEEAITTAHIQNLLKLCHPPSTLRSFQICELAISILARLSTRIKDCQCINDNGGLELMAEWLDDEYLLYPKVLEAVFDTMSCMSRNNPLVSLTIVSATSGDVPVISFIFKLIADKRPSMRLAASTFSSNLYLSKSLPPEYESKIAKVLLPTIIQLFDDPSTISLQLGMRISTIQERALDLFAYLVQNDLKLQLAASNAGIVPKLLKILLDLCPIFIEDEISIEPKSNNDKLRESALAAIAAASSLTEDCRRQVLDLDLMACIVSSMKHPSAAIRAAACKCTRSLSRSCKKTRLKLLDVGLAGPLIDALFDSDSNIRCLATATISNLVLDFEQFKKVVIEGRCIDQLVYYSKASDIELRLNAVWALKSITFQSNLETKKTVMTKLGWDSLKLLLNDREYSVQVQALNLVRNIGCTKVKDVEYLCQGIDAVDIVAFIEAKLVLTDSPEIILQAMYVLVNISLGSILIKDVIMSSPNVIRAIVTFLVLNLIIIESYQCWHKNKRNLGYRQFNLAGGSR